jgi:hypothetical protein
MIAGTDHPSPTVNEEINYIHMPGVKLRPLLPAGTRPPPEPLLPQARPRNSNAACKACRRRKGKVRKPRTANQQMVAVLLADAHVLLV